MKKILVIAIIIFCLPAISGMSIPAGKSRDFGSFFINCYSSQRDAFVKAQVAFKDCSSRYEIKIQKSIFFGSLESVEKKYLSNKFEKCVKNKKARESDNCTWQPSYIAYIDESNEKLTREFLQLQYEKSKKNGSIKYEKTIRAAFDKLNEEQSQSAELNESSGIQ